MVEAGCYLPQLSLERRVKLRHVDPLEMNAFFLAESLTVLLRPAMLRIPLYTVSGVPALFYGSMGYLLAHEMMHAFDAELRAFFEKKSPLSFEGAVVTR